MGKKQKRVYPLPHKGIENLCFQDIACIIQVLYGHTITTKGHLASLLFSSHVVFIRSGNSTAPKSIKVLEGSLELKKLMTVYLGSRAQVGLEGMFTSKEALISYIYELYIETATASGCNKHSTFYSLLLVDACPEYILNDIKKRSNKSNRHWYVLSALKNMSVMYEWFYDWIEKHALTTIFSSDPELESPRREITLLYGDIDKVVKVPTGSTLVDNEDKDG